MNGYCPICHQRAHGLHKCPDTIRSWPIPEAPTWNEARIADIGTPTPRQLKRAWFDTLSDLGVF